MVGVPEKNVLQVSSRKDKFFTKNLENGLLEPVMMKNSRGKLRKVLGKPLGLVIGDEDPDFTDFVERCLMWNPTQRLSPDDALKHIWILKGLPPQVLIHHQKMHQIETPELPLEVLDARN
jgi:dual specificity tyrosine-phosphorylation-regulated kinase 2/3/4